MARFVIGDVHGAYKALMQCLERSCFDREKDQLVCLGDVCDGWPEVKECFDELMLIKNLIYIRGNHDQWFLDYLESGVLELCWLDQGGRSTLISLKINPKPYQEFLRKSTPWCIFGSGYNEMTKANEDKLFVHGGFDVNKPLVRQKPYFLMWDRKLIDWAWRMSCENDAFSFPSFKEIYVGHTTTSLFEGRVAKPIKMGNLWAMDTGAGYEGKLTIMDIDTKAYWQSDYVNTLYTIHNGKGI